MQRNSNSIILDTHALLWLLLKPEELSKVIKDKIEQAQEDNQLLISSITFWEIAMLHSKKRINIFEPVKDFLQTINNINGLSIKEITPDIASESIVIMDGFHSDPADRIIVATAKILGATLLTRDRKILSWKDTGHVKCIEV